MSIDIPSRLEEWLHQDRSLHSAVNTSLERFESWLGSDMPFFPDFTDHGHGHVTRVLGIADFLLTEDAMNVFNSADAACLVLAVLLHDSAMQLTKDSFAKLISCKTPPPIDLLDKDSWDKMWREFFAEATRWDERKRQDVFGEALNKCSYARLEIRCLPENPSEWDELDCRLAGEFIRSNHGRLAHEISVSGIPGSMDDKSGLSTPEEFPELGNLAGLVARSHSMALRATFDTLREICYGDQKRYRGVHAIYLMTVLRIADYLDLFAERAPKQKLLFKRLKGPRSKRDWAAYDSIKHIEFESDDPESVTILADPENVEPFLRLRAWMSGIQTEMDNSWAVLGEVYGSDRKLSSLRLRLRRVRSNLDDIDTFAKRPTTRYVPRAAKFDSVGGRLLKLLVGPLYGQKPEVGIRELIQNSVDAVRELREWCNANEVTEGDLELPELERKAQVLVAVCKREVGRSTNAGDVPDDWEYWVEVSDRGIGMTTDTVVDYFLKAGASFRNDPAWAKRFIDNEGKVKVLRSGRFGIGVFAAFLLGNQLRVSTRYVESRKNDGVAFTGSLADENIQLNKISRPIGTTVHVMIDEQTFERLTYPTGSGRGSEWSWYCLNDPRVVRIQCPGKRVFHQLYTLPSLCSTATGPWHVLRPEHYKGVLWSFEADPPLTCNGIIVAESPEAAGAKAVWPSGDRLLPFVMPSVAVFDPNGLLPLNVSRFDLSIDHYPFSRVLMEEITRSFCAAFLLYAPTDLVSTSDERMDEWQVHGLTRPLCPWIRSNKGVLPPNQWNISQCDIDRLFVASTGRLLDGAVSNVLKYFNGIVAVLEVPTVRIEDVANVSLGFVDFETPFPIEIQTAQALFHKDLREYVTISSNENIQFSVVRKQRGEHLLVAIHGRCPRNATNLALYASDRYLRKRDHNDFIAEWYIGKNTPQATTFSQIWSDELLLPPAIPYDMDERLEKCSHAFERLKPYIEWHLMRCREKAKRAKRKKRVRDLRPRPEAN